jgi:hypothetical protein
MGASVDGSMIERLTSADAVGAAPSAATAATKSAIQWARPSNSARRDITINNPLDAVSSILLWVSQRRYQRPRGVGKLSELFRIRQQA